MNICKMKSVAAALTAATVLGLGLTGCGGSGSSSSGTEGTPALVTKSCAELNGMAIPAASIGLPTTGATVTSTAVVPAAGTGNAAVGEYCKVLGAISPVDPTAPQIKFQLDLPAIWNNKVMMFGGGGFDGSIPAAKSASVA